MNMGQIINILQTVLTVIMTVVPTILISFGCTQGTTGDLDCSQAIISPWTLGKIVLALGIIKTIILPWLAPGGWVRNLFGERAVVVPQNSSAATPGTVSPADVR